MIMVNSYLKNESMYSRYYGDFKGVDFSSDHTQVNEQRLAYSVNMFKDYQSGEGKSIETIPGFRRRFQAPNGGKIYGIHKFNYLKDGTRKTDVLVHSDNILYLWRNYPETTNVLLTKSIELTTNNRNADNQTFIIDLKDAKEIQSITDIYGNIVYYEFSDNILTIQSTQLQIGDYVYIRYFENKTSQDEVLFSAMNKNYSKSFVFNNTLYIIDGKNYFAYYPDGIISDGVTINLVDATLNAYIPTTYINIIPSGTNANIGTEYEQRNLLQPKFKHTFIADGTTKTFYLNENNLDSIDEVSLYGNIVNASDYDVDLINGSITFKAEVEAPKKPQDVTAENGKGYPENYAGIEITASKNIKNVFGIEEENMADVILNCNLATIFDNRVFLSGNPKYPNNVFYCNRNITGYSDPTYFGILNYFQDGVGTSLITSILPVADTLLVLKDDSDQEGTTYFHTPYETTNNIQPKIYPSTQGLSGVGCIGASINFLDDPIFISRLGVEAVGQLSVRYERSIEHRSSLIDAKLTNLELKNAKLEEWNGYLILLVDGKIFMADSRQRYIHDIGTTQYEWYYLEDIGIYDGQYTEYRYNSYMEDKLIGMTVNYSDTEIPLKIADKVYNTDSGMYEDLRDTVVKNKQVYSQVIEIEYNTITVKVKIFFTVSNDGSEAYLCYTKGNKTGGTFKKSVIPKNIDSNLFFGTENGIICSFNFDMRDEDGRIPNVYYNFDERTILCGCATKMDNCGILDYTKSTIKKSTVIKTKSMQSSATKIKVRTNKKSYEQISRINSTLFDFNNIDFEDFSFITLEQSLFSIKEKEKKWVEKQYYLYSDEYLKPFSLYYISFRYKVAGRYKG